MIIYTGTDKTITVRLFDKDQNPIDLTSVTKITVTFPGRGIDVPQLDSDLIPAIAATASSSDDSISFTATTAGILGNSISLVFDGVSTVQDVVDAWNTANPTNTVSHDGLGTEVLTSQTVSLTGGVDSYYTIEKLTPENLGRFKMTLDNEFTNRLRLGINLSILVTIDIGDDRDTTKIYNAIDVKDGTL